MSRRFTIFAVVLLAAIAVGALAVQYRSSELKTEAAASAVANPLDDVRIRPSRREGPAVNEGLLSDDRDAKGGGSTVAPLNTAADRLASPRTHDQSESTSEGVPADTRLLETDGLSVPDGGAFPVSEFIEAECKRLGNSEAGCAHTHRVLKEIESERSDLRWAPGMESRIRTVFSMHPSIRITALACRSSVCAVQTEGEVVRSPFWRPLTTDLQIVDSIWDIRTTSSGESVHVQLLVFDRRKSWSRRR